MNSEIQIRRRHNVRRLVFVTIAAAAVFLLLKPESASGSDGRRSPVGTPLARETRARVPEAGGRRATLQRIVRRLVAAGAPGAFAFVRAPAGTTGVAAGYADLGTRTPMHATDGFRIASVTKTFVATVVLQLEAEGRLDIDEPVERWLPGLVPNGSAITIRELLDHTSGLFDYSADDAHTQTVIADPGRRWSPNELLSVAFAHPPLFRPGTSWFYSNTNYVVLGPRGRGRHRKAARAGTAGADHRSAPTPRNLVRRRRRNSRSLRPRLRRARTPVCRSRPARCSTSRRC